MIVGRIQNYINLRLIFEGMSRNNDKLDEIDSKLDEINRKLDGPSIPELVDDATTRTRSRVKAYEDKKRAGRTRTQKFIQNAFSLVFDLPGILLLFFGVSDHNGGFIVAGIILAGIGIIIELL